MREFNNYTKQDHKDFQDYIQIKIPQYCTRYESMQYIYLKIIYLCLKKLISFKPKFNKRKNKDKSILKIGISLDSGIGDTVVYCLWVKAFSQYIINTNIQIDIFAHKNISIGKSLLGDYSFVNNIYSIEDFNELSFSYDLSIGFRRFPHIIHFDKEKISQFAPELSDLLEKYIEFEENNTKFLAGPSHDTQIDLYSICRGEKRVQQPDIAGILGIKANEKYSLPINPQFKEILDSAN